MPFLAAHDLLLHFESFRNIDLFHQGVYYLRVTLYHAKANSVTK